MLCVALVAALAGWADGAPPAGQTLTDDGLQAVLADLGYKPVARKYADGVRYFDITVGHDNRTWQVTAELAPNQRLVMFGIRLNTNVAGMDRDRLLRLLQENDRIKGRFLIALDGTGLYMTSYCDNRAVTPELLKTEVGIFLDEVVKTEPLWRDAKARP
jgi:hypothetical protein